MGVSYERCTPAGEATHPGFRRRCQPGRCTPSWRASSSPESSAVVQSGRSTCHATSDRGDESTRIPDGCVKLPNHLPWSERASAALSGLLCSQVAEMGRRRTLGLGADASLGVVRQLGALHRVQEAQLVLHRQHTSLWGDTVSGVRPSRTQRQRRSRGHGDEGDHSSHRVGCIVQGSVFRPRAPKDPIKPDETLVQGFRVHPGSRIPVYGRTTPNQEKRPWHNLFPKPYPRPAFCAPTLYKPETGGFQGSEFRVSGFRVQGSGILSFPTPGLPHPHHPRDPL